MRKPIHFFALAVVTLVFVLSGCGHHQEQANAVAVPTQVSVPANPNDTAAWEAYMVRVSKAHTEGMANRPYLFIVPAGEAPVAHDRRQQIQQALTGMASRNGFPGNVIAVGGPDPGMTADVVVAAFSKAKPGSLNNLTVLYTGDDSSKSRAEKSITTAGATFRYAKM